MRTIKVVRTRCGLGRVAVVTAVTCVVLVASMESATAQRRYADTLLHLSTNTAGGSHIGLTIDDVADNDGATEGAMVRDVRRESRAESAGFAEGDVIVEFDGERVRSASQLTRLVQETPAGRTVGAVVVRDQGRVELEVTPESGAATFMARPNAQVLEGLDHLRRIPDVTENLFYDFRTARTPARLGVTVQELSPQLADYFGVDDGVLISSVTEESVAAAAGLQAGDVITSVDGRAIDDTATLRRRLSAVGPGEEVSIGLTRAGRELELTATLAQDGPRRRGLRFFGQADRSL